MCSVPRSACLHKLRFSCLHWCFTNTCPGDAGIWQFPGVLEQPASGLVNYTTGDTVPSHLNLPSLCVMEHPHRLT